MPGQEHASDASDKCTGTGLCLEDHRRGRTLLLHVRVGLLPAVFALHAHHHPCGDHAPLQQVHTFGGKRKRDHHGLPS